MTGHEQTGARSRDTRWRAGAELVVAGAVLALVPRESEAAPGVWLLAALLAAGSLGLWLRGASWTDVGLAARDAAGQRGAHHALLGLALGALAALAASFLVGPGLAGLTARGVDPSVPAAVHGNPAVLLQALLIAWVHALGAEMVFRGWLLDRAEAVWPGATSRALAPLVLAGLAYGWYLGGGAPGSLASGALLGVGLGLLRRAGQGLTLPIAAHGAFASTHLALAYAGVLGGAS
jgi:hypothetical protein